MSYVNKILYALILPVMIFSFAGASMHLHVCSKKGGSISIQLPAHKDNNHSKTCCCQHDQETKNCCSSHPVEAADHELESNCCLDYDKKIETDRDYNVTQYRFNSDPVELTSIFHLTTKIYFPLSCENSFSYSDIFVTPPKLHSSIVLLI